MPVFVAHFSAKKEEYLPMWRVVLFIGLELGLLVGNTSQKETNETN